MDKPREAVKGFTMLEMMLTLFIVSILLMITAISIPQNGGRIIDQEIQNISFLFQAAQTNAMHRKEQQFVEIDRTGQRLVIRSRSGSVSEVYTLTKCEIMQGGLSRFMYKATGDTDAFGTIRFNCMGETVSFIFQIQKGRFRIER